MYTYILSEDFLKYLPVQFSHLQIAKQVQLIISNNYNLIHTSYW